MGLVPLLATGLGSGTSARGEHNRRITAWASFYLATNSGLDSEEIAGANV